MQLTLGVVLYATHQYLQLYKAFCYKRLGNIEMLAGNTLTKVSTLTVPSVYLAVYIQLIVVCTNLYYGIFNLSSLNIVNLIRHRVICSM